MIMPRVAPMVRKIPISPRLSFTSMLSPDMMLNAATRITSASNSMSTLRCTRTWSRKGAYTSRQSHSLSRGPTASAIAARAASTASGSWSTTSRPVTPPLTGEPRREKG